MKNITIDELRPLITDANLIDVRSKEQYINGHVPAARNVPATGLLANTHLFMSKEKTYYLICNTGNTSSRAGMQLADNGYDVVNVLGGTNAYAEKFELERGE